MLIKGENISISINDEIMSCWRSSTLQISADTIGISTENSGNWKEFEGVALSWTVNGEGQIWMSEDFTIHDAFDLMKTLALVFVVFFVGEYDTNGNLISQKTYYGNAIITNITETGNVNDIASFNISMQGTGELTLGDYVLYGVYPLLFNIADADEDTPAPGQTTLTLGWTRPTPHPDSYIIRQDDTTTGVTTYITVASIGLSTQTTTVVVDSADDYTFYIASVFAGFKRSDYSSGITQIATASHLADSDNILLMDSDNKTLIIP